MGYFSVENLKQHFDIPDNLAEYIKQHDGVNLSININSASADYGYAHCVHYSVVLSVLTRTCHHCGYDPLWNPDDSASKCGRHRYGNWRYDTVFSWSPADNPISLEKAFDMWLEAQPKQEWKPAKLMNFGLSGWYC